MKTTIAVMSLVATLGAGAAAAATQPTDVTTAPVLVKDVKPSYTKAAMDARLQGTVVMAVTVKSDGSVGKVRVTQHLSPDMDAQAVKAAKQWRFSPGTKNGKPVRVEIPVEMSFSLR